jgi:BirA family biotin operon repressor/biotin-[acetyl-CoA-carboxylase] ligase
MLSSALLQSILAGLPLGGLRYFDSIGSTNDVALTWARAGAPDFSLVVADTQTAGRGRMQRHWVTNPGAALAFSLVLRPAPQESQHLTRFSPFGAVAVRQALAAVAGLTAEIKWPNDVLLRRCKIAGVLAESIWEGSDLLALVLGIGANIAPSAVPPPAGLNFPATCVETVLGHPVDRWVVLRAILESLLAWRPHLCTEAFLKEWQAHLALRGEWVRIGAAGCADLIGMVQDINADGSLRLMDKEGKELLVSVGDVHLSTLGEQESSSQEVVYVR